MSNNEPASCLAHVGLACHCWECLEEHPGHYPSQCDTANNYSGAPCPQHDRRELDRQRQIEREERPTLTLMPLEAGGAL